MTKLEFLKNHFYKLIGVEMLDCEIIEIIDICHKVDTHEGTGNERYLEDCIRIREACRKAGYDVGLGNACALWSEFSESRASGWEGLPDSDEEIITALNRWEDLERYYFKL